MEAQLGPVLHSKKAGGAVPIATALAGKSEFWMIGIAS